MSLLSVISAATVNKYSARCALLLLPAPVHNPHNSAYPLNLHTVTQTKPPKTLTRAVPSNRRRRTIPMAAVLHNSSLFEPISNPTLPPAQAQVIAALAQGRSVTAAALEAGIHRTTIHNWLPPEPAFKAAGGNAQR